MTKIYVGNLPFTATEDEVRAMFEAHGAVHSVNLITDRYTGQPRGFCFVEMDERPAKAAIGAINGQDMNGRSLKVDEAKPRRDDRRGGRGDRGNRW
jgi:RNA recognition motif-containing protein